MSDTDKLGRNQKHILNVMHRFGNGTWKQGWRLTYAQRQVMNTLMDRGLVERVENPDGTRLYKITE